MSKKVSSECQTTLQCHPFILRKGDRALVQSDHICQTEISLPPSISDLELYRIIRFIDPELITKDAMNIIDVPGFMRADNSLRKLRKSYLRYKNSPNRRNLRKVLSYASIKSFESVHIIKNDCETKTSLCQTELMVYPHILMINEYATIKRNVHCQTSCSLKPRASLSEVIPRITMFRNLNEESREEKEHEQAMFLNEIIDEIVYRKILSDSFSMVARDLDELSDYSNSFNSMIVEDNDETFISKLVYESIFGEPMKTVRKSLSDSEILRGSVDIIVKPTTIMFSEEVKTFREENN